MTTIRESLIPLTAGHLPQGSEIVEITPNFVIYRLIPVQANLGYKIELFDTNEPLSTHYHQIQTQILIILEGRVKIKFSDEEIVLRAGQRMAIPPYIQHNIEPLSHVRFLAIDIPGFCFPDDVCFENFTSSEISRVPYISDQHNNLDQQTKLTSDLLEAGKKYCIVPEKYYQAKIEEKDYIAYPLVTAPNHAWSIAILEVQSTPAHFHKIETEHFIVLNGEINITIADTSYFLQAAQSVHITPGTLHSFKSNTSAPARLLCINFPAFDPDDFYHL